jgi:voltage-gated potassium channel
MPLPAGLTDPLLSAREALRPFGRRFAWAGAYFLVLSLAGTAGYVLLEGWGWFEALYMTVTSITSVGYGEIRPLSPGGRTFTMVLIGFSVTGLGIWWALTTALIVELDLRGLLRRRQMFRRIEKLADHFIVCGGGRFGRVVVEEMVKTKTPFVLIEKNPERAARFLADHPDILVIEDDATKEHTLQAAQIQAAHGLAACLAEDADNLLLCITAHYMKPELNVVARANDEESLDKLRRAGADHVISPNVTGGIRMASMLLRPSVVSFLDVASTAGGPMALRLEETRIPDSSRLAGKSLADARIRERTGLIVLALNRGRQQGRIYNPGPELRLEGGDVMIVLGQEEQIQSLREYLKE